ncbi:hemoglobin [Leifsonia sp. AK011]|uniref:group I truncated hemoglobin n=1 Tax=Leifsonia sp. AK011 TaxID=2723075 RepID=UPI0015C6C87D|nr:group 1 truncated hemoglobin [Leifsonia sp. AK011]NYF09608.1 hemoglobin [Leifsonia sp. AK011]
MSVYDEIGGDAAVSLAVESFYDRVMADATLSPYFEGMNLHAIKDHQRDFFTVLLDGPEVYDGRSMRNAHAGLHITDEVFTRTLQHLAATLDELDVTPPLKDQVLRRIEVMRAAIVEVR